jgi:hypothetical protein
METLLDRSGSVGLFTTTEDNQFKQMKGAKWQPLRFRPQSMGKLEEYPAPDDLVYPIDQKSSAQLPLILVVDFEKCARA